MTNIIDFRRKKNSFSKIMSLIKQLKKVDIIPYTIPSINHSDIIRVSVEYYEDSDIKHPLVKKLVIVLDEINKYCNNMLEHQKDVKDNNSHKFLIESTLKEIVYIINRDVTFAVLIDITPNDFLYNIKDPDYICNKYKSHFNEYQAEFIKYVNVVTDIVYNLDDVLSKHNASSDIYVERVDNLRSNHINFIKMIEKYAINTYKTMLEKIEYSLVNNTKGCNTIDEIDRTLKDNDILTKFNGLYKLYMESFINIVNGLLYSQNIDKENFIENFCRNIRNSLIKHLDKKKSNMKDIIIKYIIK